MPTRRTRILLLCLTLIPVLSARSDLLPEELTLQYRVSLGSAELGRLSTRLRRAGNMYQVDSRTQAEGLASILLGGDVKESCIFSVKANEVQTLNYEVIREGRRGYRHTVKFDWDAGTIQFKNGDTRPLPSGYTLDNCSVPFAFMVGKRDTFVNRMMHIVGGNRIRHFTNSSITEERLATPLGVLDSIRIEQQRHGRPERTFTVWVAPSRGNLPVKIVERRPSRVTTMLLTSVSGL